MDDYDVLRDWEQAWCPSFCFCAALAGGGDSEWWRYGAGREGEGDGRKCSLCTR
jgi:hypothetical protein